MFVLGKLFQPSQLLGRTGAYPSETPFRCFTFG